MPTNTMTIEHPDWPAFRKKLATALGSPVDKVCNHSFSNAKFLLALYDCDEASSLEYFHERRAHCDCELLLNVGGNDLRHEGQADEPRN
jgi:hypothetical protein